MTSVCSYLAMLHLKYDLVPTAASLSIYLRTLFCFLYVYIEMCHKKHVRIMKCPYKNQCVYFLHDLRRFKHILAFLTPTSWAGSPARHISHIKPCIPQYLPFIMQRNLLHVFKKPGVIKPWCYDGDSVTIGALLPGMLQLQSDRYKMASGLCFVWCSRRQFKHLTLN